MPHIIGTKTGTKKTVRNDSMLFSVEVTEKQANSQTERTKCPSENK